MFCPLQQLGKHQLFCLHALLNWILKQDMDPRLLMGLAVSSLNPEAEDKVALYVLGPLLVCSFAALPIPTHSRTGLWKERYCKDQLFSLLKAGRTMLEHWAGDRPWQYLQMLPQVINGIGIIFLPLSYSDLHPAHFFSREGVQQWGRLQPPVRA